MQLFWKKYENPNKKVNHLKNIIAKINEIMKNLNKIIIKITEVLNYFLILK